jgi:vacuolar-type H+-ATPase subunit I/STV1
MRFDFFAVFLIILIIIFSFVTEWQFENFQKNISKINQIKLPKIEIPKFPIQGEETKKEFKSEDGYFKFNFSGDWIEISKEQIANIYPVEKNSKVLFVAQKVKLPKISLASLVVQEFSYIKTKEELIEKIQTKLKETNQKMEILNEEKDYFEAKYTGKNLTLISREKIIFGESKIYLISFFVPESNLNDFENEIKEILNSIQILK